MKKIEADGLLNLYSAALQAVFPDVPDLDIAAEPEIVHVLLLTGEQLLESLLRDAIHRPLGSAAEFFSRSRPGGMIDHVFRELNWRPTLRRDREGDLPEVLGMNNLRGVLALGLQSSVSGSSQQ